MCVSSFLFFPSFFFTAEFCLDNQVLSGEAQVCLCGVCVHWALFSSGVSPPRGSQICQRENQTLLNLLQEKRKEKRGVRQQAQTSPHGALPNVASRGLFTVMVRIQCVSDSNPRVCLSKISCKNWVIIGTSRNCKTKKLSFLVTCLDLDDKNERGIRPTKVRSLRNTFMETVFSPGLSPLPWRRGFLKHELDPKNHQS